MGREAALALVNNAALLISLTVIYSALYIRFKKEKLLLQKIISGLLLGVIAMAVMVDSWELSPGVVFDTRSVVLGLTGLYFGFIPSIITVIMTSILRILMGGSGAAVGVSVIICSATTGLLWRYRRRRALHQMTLVELYLFGIVVHIFMMIGMLFLPADPRNAFFSVAAVPVMLVYPIATALTGWAMSSKEAQLRGEEAVHELSLARKRLAAIVEASPVPIISLDMEYNVTEWNQAAEKVFGWKRSEVIGRPLPIVPEEDVQNHRDLTEKTRSGDYQRGTLLLRKRKDGSKVVVRLHNATIFNEEGQPEGILGILEDVTRQQEAERALKESETRFRELYTNMNTGVAIYKIGENDEAVFLDMNPAGCRITGVSRDEIVGRRVEEIFPGVIEMGLYDIIIQVFKSGLSQRHPLKKYKDNRIAFWTDNYVYRHGKDEIVVIFEDITQREKTLEELERRVKKRTAELEAVNKELESFAYSVSHDLRAPLRAIKGFAQIISERYAGALPSEAGRYFDYIVKAGENMSILIQDLLDYSRLGRVALKIEAVSLAHAVDKALDTLCSKIDEERGKITVEGTLHFVEADITLLNRVLANLIENALTYHAPERPPEINISSRREDGYVFLTIKDNGIGIDRKFHNKIFEIFQRLHSADDYQGTGIGLAIVRKCVDLMGGEISLESMPGEGSVFSVKLKEALN
ncbi:MAG TPA: PAS domain S-box protein [Mesotoga sp.]|nr:PAS domain S-box protein [Mesotoga sp.]